MKKTAQQYYEAAATTLHGSPEQRKATKLLFKHHRTFKLPHGGQVETWNHRRHWWVTQVKDAAGNQIGDAAPVGPRCGGSPEYNHFVAIKDALAALPVAPRDPAAKIKIVFTDANGKLATATVQDVQRHPTNPDAFRAKENVRGVLVNRSFLSTEVSAHSQVLLNMAAGPVKTQEPPEPPEPIAQPMKEIAPGFASLLDYVKAKQDGNLPPAWQQRFPRLRVDHAGPCASIGDGQQRIEYGYRSKPSWKTTGNGWANVRIDTQRDGSLYVVASEAVEDAAGLLQKRKEVFFEIPKQVVDFIKANG